MEKTLPHTGVPSNQCASTNKTHCASCSLNTLCLPLSLSKNDTELLDRIVKRSRPIHKGDYVFKQGEPFRSLFAIRTGSVKNFTIRSDGEEQITGFHLASELIGLSGFNDVEYPESAVALETTTVCELPIDQLDHLSDSMPNLRKQVLSSMGQEIRHDQQLLLMLSKKTADERIAFFILNLGRRFQRRGYSAKSFRLSMSRIDIANHLGMAVETVSRVFTRFQKAGYVQAEGKEIVICDPDALSRMSGESQDTPCTI